jgi:hypothetical protein
MEDDLEGVKLKKSILTLALAITMLIVPIVSGTIQTYSTDLGKIQINLPYILAPDDSISSGTSLDLGLKITPDEAFPNIDWMNVVWINLYNLTEYHEKSAEDLVNLWAGDASDDPDNNWEVQEMLTNDHHKMLFYTITPKKQPPEPSHYYAFIDYQSDKNSVVRIDALSERYWFKPIATFDKAEFQDICKSFTFISG